MAAKHGLTLAEIALRWVSHHSLMKREYGDSILIGASSLKHVEQVSVALDLDLVVYLISEIQELDRLGEGPAS